MRKSLTSIISLFMLGLLPVIVGLFGQANGAAPSDCSQTTEVQNVIIREAERDRYTTRRIVFIGNQYTRDDALKSRIDLGLQEGDLFTRRNLSRSLRSVTTLKRMYPVTIADVVLHLNPSEKTIDVFICFKEREGRKSKRAG